MRAIRAFLLIAGWLASPAAATCLYVAPEAPTTLGGTTYLPWQVVRYKSGAWSLALDLPPGTSVDALQRTASGDWLFSVDAPATLGGTTYQPSDIVRMGGGGAFAPFFCGAASGVPAGVDVDAAYLPSGGASPLVVSFDVPVTLGATTVDPSDLVRFVPVSGCTWSFAGISFDASAAAPPVDVTSNVTAADRTGASEILGFDVPTTLGAATFLPGDLASWNGGAFALFESLAGWPVSSVVNGISFLPGPGLVGNTMTVQRLLADGSLLRINWGASCSPGGTEDYGIYEGTLSSWYSHSLIDCNDAGADLTEDIGTTSGNRYYLVVPNNCDGEGSYGMDSNGAQRPTGAPACASPQVIAPCP